MHANLNPQKQNVRERHEPRAIIQSRFVFIFVPTIIITLDMYRIYRLNVGNECAQPQSDHILQHFSSSQDIRT